MLSDVVDVILRDNGLSDTAARLALVIARKGEGWHEISPAEFARGVSGYPSAEKVARHLKQLEVAGYVERKAGGRGHSDRFQISERILDPTRIPDLSANRPPSDAGAKVLDPTPEQGLNALVVAVGDGVDNPPVVPPPLDERTAAALQQHDELFAGCRGALRDYLTDYVPEPRKRYAFVQLVAGWLNGIDPNVWRLPDGSLLPPDERPGALALALNDLGASTRTMKSPPGDPANLRTKLGVHLRQRTDKPTADPARPSAGVVPFRRQRPSGSGIDWEKAAAEQPPFDPNRMTR